jgi:urease accessory protein
MLVLNKIIGHSTDQSVAEQLHDVSHHGIVEHLVLSKDDVLRRRLRMKTDKGTECAIQLSRNEMLSNGAVLLLEDKKAIVVQMAKVEYLCLRPTSVAAALEVGYFCGNMHWKVDFEGDLLRIMLSGPKERYIERIFHFISDVKIELMYE